MSTLKSKWEQYTNWLSGRLPQYAKLLNKGATQKQLNTLKTHFDFILPEELFELYSLNNGDNVQNSKLYLGAFMGLEFLSIQRLIEEYDFWNSIPEKNNLEQSKYCRSKPEGVVKKNYVNPKWVPVFMDGGGNCIGIDLDPDVNGVKGQINNFGRDEDEKINIEGLLDLILEEIANGNCNKAIVKEDDGGYSYGLRPQSHLIDDLKKMKQLK